VIPNDIIRHLAKTIPAVIVLFSAAVPPQGNSLLAGIQQALGYVRTEQAAIAGITVGSTEEQLFHALGKPTELKDLPSGRDSTKNVRLFRYPGVDVEVAGGKVSVVRCSAPRYATPDGVRVGDSLVRPIRLYGATKFDIAGDERVDWYGVMNTDAFLVFRFRAQQVRAATETATDVGAVCVRRSGEQGLCRGFYRHGSRTGRVHTVASRDDDLVRGGAGLSSNSCLSQ